ncbi:MAG: aminopeptidase, partial [Cyclobacteriaceae bacterium]|nr:aminopeptidase [Cyclobacteriaceae bacterium]
MKIVMLPLFAGLLMVSSCQKPQPAETNPVSVPHHLDFELIAQVLVERMDLQPGERVLMVGKPGDFNPLVEQLKKNIVKAGATYLGTLSVGGSAPESWRSEFTKSYMSTSAGQALALLEDVDLGIMLPGATPEDDPYALFQERLESGGRAIHFHWTGAYDLNGNLLAMDSIKDQFYQQVLVETDYAALARGQAEFEKAMRSNTIRVTTPEGTDISFSIGDRPVTKQDGNASAARAEQGRNLIDREVELPAGAVRVAPMEESVNGIVIFPDAEWDGVLVRSLSMTFEQGIAIEIEAHEGQQAVMDIMENAGVSAKSFRE